LNFESADIQKTTGQLHITIPVSATAAECIALRIHKKKVDQLRQS
jgi:hypothetical protein